MKKHRYTKEQIEFIRKLAPGRERKEIRDIINEKYNLDVTTKSIAGVMYRNNIKNRMQGYNTRFEKGQKAWNKGKPFRPEGSSKSWFKKGHTDTRSPIGSESMKDDRVMIKIAQPDVWVEKHRWLWEQHYGKIPEGTAIAFKDGDKSNVTIDNLFATTTGASAAVARRKLPDHDPDLKVASHRLAELDIVIKKSSGGELA